MLLSSEDRYSVTTTNDESVLVREICESDLCECAAIFANTFSKPPWNEDWSAGLAHKRLLHLYRSAGFYGVLVQQDQVSAFVIGNIEPYLQEKIFYLREMCADVLQQRKGLGTKLIHHMEHGLRKKRVSRVYLMTTPTFPSAAFYLRQKFIKSEYFSVYTKNIATEFD